MVRKWNWHKEEEAAANGRRSAQTDEGSALTPSPIPRPVSPLPSTSGATREWPWKEGARSGELGHAKAKELRREDTTKGLANRGSWGACTFCIFKGVSQPFVSASLEEEAVAQGQLVVFYITEKRILFLL